MPDEKLHRMWVNVVDKSEADRLHTAARERGYNSFGAWIRALLKREGVELTEISRGGWRGGTTEDDSSES